jgi:hypothetical protein
MSPLRLTALQWVNKHRMGMAAIMDGHRYVVVHQATTGEPAFVEVAVKEPDMQSVVVDGRLDAEDLARVLTGFRVPPLTPTADMHYVRASDDATTSAYVFDEESGTVYILE